jgi:protein ImuB
LRLREAQARCSSLLVVPHDDQLDIRLFEPIVMGLEQLVPGVQVIRPGVCAMRSRGPSRYYGGEERAADALLRLLEELGVPDARIGIADGPFAAEQAARGTDARGIKGARGLDDAGTADRIRIVESGGSARFLAPLPVDILGELAVITVLNRLGIRCLGDIAALDALDLQNRFGEFGLRAHRLATGTDGSTVVPRAPRKTLERTVEFEPGLDRIDQVAFGMKQAADDFSAGITAAGLVCTAIVVRVLSEAGELSERNWLHPRWFTSADVVDRVRWQLQGSGGTDSGLASPIVKVTIVPESVDAIANHEDGLWGAGPDERVHHVLSRVQSMLGHEAVLTPRVGGGRLLEKRQVLVPWGDRSPEGSKSGVSQEGPVSAPSEPWPGSLPPPLPATVFAPPRSVGVFTVTGDHVDLDARGVVTGEPALFSLRSGPVTEDSTRAVSAWTGPWPVDERWWDSAEARSLSRFVLVDEKGLAWLLFLEEHGWFLEARYD